MEFQLLFVIPGWFWFVLFAQALLDWLLIVEVTRLRKHIKGA